MSLSRNILPLLMLLSLGCSHRGEIVHATDVDPTGWSTPAEVRFEVRDTHSLFNIDLMVRYDNLISPDSIELLVSTITPDSVVWSEYFVAATPKDNKHSIYILESPYRKHVKWRQEGEYRVILHPQQVYWGISSVGIDIKPSINNN